MLINTFKRVLLSPSGQGLLLIFAAVLAMVIENSPLNVWYDQLLNTRAIIQIGEFAINKPLLLWINDGLMAIFFLLIGLEVKRELIEGQLSQLNQAILPIIAAIGGLIVPALFYTTLNVNGEDVLAMRGWAIPTATDIAFALGILALLGNCIPITLKIFLGAVAIIDDLAAIIIIAIFYTEGLSLLSLGIAATAIGVLATLNYRGVTALSPYILVGIILWTCVLKSGVHATLAGVALAFFIPLKSSKTGAPSPLKKLEHDLHPWIVYAVLPIFAFANAGVSFAGLTIDTLLQPITLGIALGLFVGKQLGVMLFSGLAVFSKLCTLPENISWAQYYGIALLTGVGFTMSLFIGTLAFDDYDHQTSVRLGVVIGSLLSGVLGFFVLYFAKGKKETA